MCVRKMLGAGFAVLVALWSAAALAQGAATGQLRIVVGTSVGATYDAYARLVAQHMPKYLPGHPTIVVQNMAGAGGLTAANYLFNVAPKDGSTFGVFARGLPIQPLLDPRGIQFKPEQFTWLGSPTSETSLVWSWHTTPFNTFTDVMQREMIIPATGPGADSFTFPFVMNAILGTRFKIVPGYPGSPELFMAVEKGEAEGVASTSWNNFVTGKADWVRDGKVRFLLQLGLKKMEELKDVPLVLDFAKTESDRRALELIFSRNTLAYPFAAPPGLPAEKAQALRSAFDQTMADAEFRADALRQNLQLDPTLSAEMTRLIDALAHTDPQIVERVRAALAEGEKTALGR